MTIAQLTQPATEPLTLSEVKEHLRVDHNYEDTLITATLAAARQHTEYCSGQKLISQTWRQYDICFPVDGHLPLRLAPVQTILAVTGFDRDGNPHSIDLQNIGINRAHNPVRMELAGDIDPSLMENGLETDLLVGWGDLGVDVPDGLKRAILLLTAHWYEFRGAVSPQDQPVSIPAGFEALVAPYKRMSL